MRKCGWENGDDKMLMIKRGLQYGWQNADDKCEWKIADWKMRITMCRWENPEPASNANPGLKVTESVSFIKINVFLLLCFL